MLVGFAAKFMSPKVEPSAKVGPSALVDVGTAFPSGQLVVIDSRDNNADGSPDGFRVGSIILHPNPKFESAEDAHGADDIVAQLEATAMDGWRDLRLRSSAHLPDAGVA